MPFTDRKISALHPRKTRYEVPEPWAHRLVHPGDAARPMTPLAPHVRPSGCGRRAAEILPIIGTILHIPGGGSRMTCPRCDGFTPEDSLPVEAGFRRLVSGPEHLGCPEKSCHHSANINVKRAMEAIASKRPSITKKACSEGRMPKGWRTLPPSHFRWSHPNCETTLQTIKKRIVRILPKVAVITRPFVRRGELTDETTHAC